MPAQSVVSEGVPLGIFGHSFEELGMSIQQRLGNPTLAQMPDDHCKVKEAESGQSAVDRGLEPSQYGNGLVNRFALRLYANLADLAGIL